MGLLISFWKRCTNIVKHVTPHKWTIGRFHKRRLGRNWWKIFSCDKWINVQEYFPIFNLYLPEPYRMMQNSVVILQQGGIWTQHVPNLFKDRNPNTLTWLVLVQTYPGSQGVSRKTCCLSSCMKSCFLFSLLFSCFLSKCKVPQFTKIHYPLPSPRKLRIYACMHMYLYIYICVCIYNLYIYIFIYTYPCTPIS